MGIVTPKHVAPRTLLAGTIATLAIAGVVAAWLPYSYRRSDAAASAPAALPQVVVSKPLEREVARRIWIIVGNRFSPSRTPSNYTLG